MATYLVGHIRIMDATLWQQYVDGVRELLPPFAAEVDAACLVYFAGISVLDPPARSCLRGGDCEL